MTTYILDTTVVSDLANGNANVRTHIDSMLKIESRILVPSAVVYEFRRILIKRNATKQLHHLRHEILPLFEPYSVEDEHWLLAARFWAMMTSTGKQLSDVDLLLAAITYRLQGVLVSSDDDFDALPIKRENWR